MKKDIIPNQFLMLICVGSYWVHIGYMANSKYHEDHLSAVTRELPDFLEYMEIIVSTYDDKYFCITIECIFHSDYKNTNLKEMFIHIDDWIEYEKNNLIGRKRKGPKKTHRLTKKYEMQ